MIARTLLTEPVYARLDRATPDEQGAMRKGQPNTFLVFDRLGIDPFTDLFEVTLLAEGTVRGTGGVRIADHDLSTDVPGLYAAGDTTTRELICGGFTGGGVPTVCVVPTVRRVLAGESLRWPFCVGRQR